MPVSTKTSLPLELKYQIFKFTAEVFGRLLGLERYITVVSNATGIFLRGVGSEARVVTPDIEACNGIIHTVDTVLLPFDGDGELDGEAGDLNYDITLYSSDKRVNANCLILSSHSFARW